MKQKGARRSIYKDSRSFEVKKKMGLFPLIILETPKGVTTYRIKMTSTIFAVKHTEGIIHGLTALWKFSQIVFVYSFHIH